MSYIISSGGTEHSMLWGKGHYIIWETGHSILWDPEHLSSGIWNSYSLGSGTSSGIRDIGKGTRYPLGSGPVILWDHAIWEMRYNLLGDLLTFSRGTGKTS